MVSFLHTADLHMGMRVAQFDPERAKKVRECRFRALDNVVKAARERHVDFILIAGDLFDDHAVDQTTARRVFLILEDAPMPVYILSGNHDPLLPGAVWDRSPWSDAGAHKVRVLRAAEPLEVAPGVVLYPCPVWRKNSMNDPTAWIASAPFVENTIRIGVAHGSLKIGIDLPPDDHPIEPYAVDQGRLDYLALGHWHRQFRYPDRGGVERTAYAGVHEPMRFPGSGTTQTGWCAYAGDREEFKDGGRGESLLVTIRGPGAPPELETLNVGHLIWQEEAHQLSSQEQLSHLIREVAQRVPHEVRLLRLKLTGVLDAAAMLRLEELREILEGSYLLGELDLSGLHIQPTAEQIQDVAGEGILRGVLERLQIEAGDMDPATRLVAERAMLLLYQIAHEVKA